MSATRVKKWARRTLGDAAYSRLAGFGRYIAIRPSVRDAFLHQHDIIFYCEQPSHWQNIDLVVRHIIRQHPSLRIRLLATYKSEDYPDVSYPPSLSVDHNIPKSALGHLRTRVLYTPYAGLDWRLRPKGSVVVHTLVSLTGLDGVYSSDMFDSYDYVICAGPHQIRDFQRWADTNARLKGKVLIPAGYPKLDLMIDELRQLPTSQGDVFTVVYAPTHVYPINENLASLRGYGELIVNELLAAGFRVIFRPHPVSFKDVTDKEVVHRIIEMCSADSNFILDRSKNYIETYARADVMVTDLSGTGFTFSLSLLRPTVFFSANPDAESGLRGIQFEDREKVGALVRSVPELIEVVEALRSKDGSESIPRYRDETVFNVGSSAEATADALGAVLDGRRSSDWVRL